MKNGRESGGVWVHIYLKGPESDSIRVTLRVAQHSSAFPSNKRVFVCLRLFCYGCNVAKGASLFRAQAGKVIFTHVFNLGEE